MYLFAISAIRCTIHRTYSKGDKQPVHAPWGPKEYIYGKNCKNDTRKIDSLIMMTLGWMTSGSICVYEYGSSVKSCFESHFCKSPISMWVYVTFHLQWFWKGNWLHSNLVPGLFMEFALSHTIRFDLLPLDLSKGYHFFVQMNGLGRFASIGCVGAASCSFDSCSVHRAIRRSLPRSHICTKPSERCRIPTDILNHPGKASGRC